MIDSGRSYRAYLLRLWRVNSGGSMVWHVSLEDSRTGERRGFADLKGLFEFLEEQTNKAGQRNTGEKGGRL
jgi:hypothetical protein